MKELLSKITKHKYEFVVFLVILSIACYLRISQLGFSNFYGDETKTFYLRKDVAARDFLLDQRKGPIQFLVVWSVEKVFGLDEFFVRLPFALAGLFSVVIFYFLVRKIFGPYTAIFAALLMSLNGFFVAFSRTAQYQSFLTLFGLLAVISAVYFYSNQKKVCLFASGFFVGLAFLTHYDAVFYLIPTLGYLVKSFVEKKALFKVLFLYFLVPAIVLISSFYIPYIKAGYFVKNTYNYIARRVEGLEYKPNRTLYTYSVYNPVVVGAIPLAFFFVFLFGKFNWQKSLTLLWFLVPYFVFETFFSNPGTHIIHFLVPLFILCSLGIVYLMRNLRAKFALYTLAVILGIGFYSAFYVTSAIYLPFLSRGYPWVGSDLGKVNLKRVDKTYHLYLYGFPYNAGWDQIRDYFVEKGSMPRSFYTNDNVTIGEYYLFGVPAHTIHFAKMPEYYISVENGQELNEPDPIIYERYLLEKEFFVGSTLVSRLYRYKF